MSKKRRGGILEKFITQPDYSLLEKMIKDSQGYLKIVTLAPELPGILPLIKELSHQNIIASLGHSDASYEEAKEGIKFGITHATHFFNAMPPFHHRKPGAIGAIFDSPEVSIEVTADGFHLHPATLRLVLKAKGLDKVNLITDGNRAVGMPDGRYLISNQWAKVEKGRSLLSDGTIAGSVLTMNKAVKNIMEFANLSLSEAVRLATLNPAKVLGIEDKKGSLSPGKDADITVMNPVFEVLLTMVSGKIIFEKS